MSLPPFRFRPVRPGLARVVRHALGALGRIAEESVGNSWRRGDGGPTMVAEIITAPLEAAGFNRAAALAQGVAQSMKAGVPDAPMGPRLRQLAGASLLAAAAARYPDGPAPRDSIEPVLRDTCRGDESPRLAGRVLIPLTDQIAWDVKARMLVEVASVPEVKGHVVLARRVTLGLTQPLIRMVVHGASAGVPLGPSSDRRMLHHAEPSLARVAAALAASLGDPLSDGVPPMLVGPLTGVRRSESTLTSPLVRDARGCRARLEIPPGVALPIWGPPLHALVHVTSRDGHLTLRPELVWVRGRRIPLLLAVTGAPPTPWMDELVSLVHQQLMELTVHGVDAHFAQRARLRAAVARLAAAGFAGLAALVDRAFPADGTVDARAFLAAAHRAHAVLHAPRWIAADVA